jgi:hypothetical protein
MSMVKCKTCDSLYADLDAGRMCKACLDRLDHFAGLAMQGYISVLERGELYMPDETEREALASEAYGTAAAMLAERAKLMQQK